MGASISRLRPGKAQLSATTALPEEVGSVRLTDIDGRVVEAVVRQLPVEFDTWDVSGHRDFLRAHAGLVDEYQFHSMVGRYLSRHRTELGLTYLGQTGRKSAARWRHT